MLLLLWAKETDLCSRILKEYAIILHSMVDHFLKQKKGKVEIY